MGEQLHRGKQSHVFHDIPFFTVHNNCVDFCFECNLLDSYYQSGQPRNSRVDVSYIRQGTASAVPNIPCWDDSGDTDHRILGPACLLPIWYLSKKLLKEQDNK